MPVSKKVPGRGNAVPRRRFAAYFRIPVLVAFAGVFFSFWCFHNARQQEQTRVEQAFTRAFSDRVAHLRDHANDDLLYLHVVGTSIGSSDQLTAERFGEFAHPLVNDSTQIQALAWIPRVHDVDRLGDWPVQYIEQVTGNEPVAGFDDQASAAAREKAMSRACQTGESAATAPLSLIGETGGQQGVLVFAPVYRNGSVSRTPEDRTTNLRGFVVAAFRIGDLVESAITPLAPAGIDTHVYDRSDPGNIIHLYTHWARTSDSSTPLAIPDRRMPQGNFQSEMPLEMAGRTWSVVGIAEPQMIESARTWQPWWALCGGTLTTGLLVGYMLTVQQHARKADRLVRQLTISHAAVHESAERLRLALDSAQLGTFDFRPITGEIFWDARNRQIWGMSTEQSPDYNGALQRVHPEDAARVDQNVQATLAPASNGHLESEYRIVWPDGSVHWVTSKGQVHFVGEGASRRANRVIGVQTDITQRKLAEQQLLKLSTAVKESPALIVITDAAANIEYVNPKFCEVTGYSPQEVIGKNPRLLQSGLTPPEFYRDMWAMLRIGREWHGEFHNRKKNGELYWESASISPVLDAAGNIINFVAIKEDITARKLADEALRQTAAQLEEAQRIARMGHFDLDVASGRIVWSAELFRLFERDPAIGPPTYQQLLGYFVPEDAIRVDGANAKAIQTGETTTLDLTVQLPSGIAAHHHAIITPVMDDKGNVIRVRGTSQDITEQRAMEEARARQAELEHERARLSESNQAMTRVIGVLGHELRTPLAGLRAMSELLMDDCLDSAEQAKEMLTSLNGEVIRMAELVNNMLEVTRLNSGLANWTWGTVALRETCQAAVEPVSPLIDGLRVRLMCDVPAGLRMSGDADAVRRLVLNLVSNAQKHTSDGQIAVTATNEWDAESRWIRLQVRDTGKGIPPQVAAKLGEAFALNSGMIGADHIRGSGLGLAICRGIIAAHGGTISVASAAGRGTTISIRLRADLPEPARLDTVAIEHEVAA